VAPRRLRASQVLAAAGLFLLAGAWTGDPPWLLDRDLLLTTALFAVALVVYSAQVTRAPNDHAGRPAYPPARALVGAGITVLLVFALVRIGDLGVTGSSFVFLSTAFVALSLGQVSPLSERLKVTVNVAVFGIALAACLPGAVRSLPGSVSGAGDSGRDASTRYVFSSLHDLKITELPVMDPEPDQRPGGGIAVIDQNRVLVGSGGGAFVVVDLTDNSPSVTKTGVVAPINGTAFRRDIRGTGRWFRVTDVFLQESPDAIRSLWVSHHHWNSEGKCATLRLSQAEVDVESPLLEDPTWQTRFESFPCLELGRGRPLTGHNGGRIAFLPPNSILLTVGAHRYPERVEELTGFDDSAFGKIFEIDLTTGQASVLSSGHRNAQGLLVTETTVWSTEHGPDGGDELNVIERGSDYGWPRSTYGIVYSAEGPGRGDESGRHAFGHKPFYSWIPSIGVSNLIELDGEAFTGWQGDLLVGSLDGRGNGRSLFRLRVEDDRVVLSEPIFTGLPIRDLVELDDGRLVLWDGTRNLQLVEPSPQAASACGTCHTWHPFQAHGEGPDLTGIVGARVAREDAFPYSDALRALGGRWTPDRLDAFIRAPAEFVPGTSMNFDGIQDPVLRSEIVRYFTEAPGPRG
jgi:cytochrome c2